METEDVTLDEMAREICKWMQKQVEHDEFNDWWLWEIAEGKWTDPDRVKIREEKAHCGYADIKVPISDLYESLDVIREVEEALVEVDEMYELYIENRCLVEDPDPEIIKSTVLVEMVDNHDAETRLRAIYATLRESGEI